jgi:hypothetical protein
MKLLGIALAVVVACVVLFKLKYPTYAYRYRMTVTVVVDGQVHSGSSVIEVRVSKQPVFLPTVNRLDYADRGEAVFVDLGEGRNIVALLASAPYAERSGLAVSLVPSHFKLDLFKDAQLASLPALRGRWELADSELPTLVTFSNPADPATVSVIRPEQLEQAFGPRVRWRGVSIEMTNDAVTQQIESRLSWVTKLTAGLSGGSVLTFPGKFTINGSYFKRS